MEIYMTEGVNGYKSGKAANCKIVKDPHKI